METFFLYISNMGFKEQQAAIEKELDRFMDLLGVMLPRYNNLLKQPNLNSQELHELGELEHFLIGVTGRISEIKNLLELDIFGHSLHQYYKEKIKAEKGDLNALDKLTHLRKTFGDALESGELVNWN